MPKLYHEFRDPIHIFIKMFPEERAVVDSRPFQRLRNISQLALTNLVYPGATHKRFEHSLGVMEIASRIFDVLTETSNRNKDILDIFPKHPYELLRWRFTLRMAALCHDIGHLPFSHASEKELFPKGWNHEKMTATIILGDEMRPFWKTISINANEIVKLALGPKEVAGAFGPDNPDFQFSNWETILSEIIVSDTFGADRIDYLLRDSHHAGVAYGKFDHYRLIDTLRILPFECNHSGTCEEKMPFLGIEGGGLKTVESLIVARYLMYTQLYFHPVRRIYDIHLKEFLMKLFPKGIPITIPEYLGLSDNDILSEIYKCSEDSSCPLNELAKRIARRKHYKLLYERHPDDSKISLEPGKEVYEEACKAFGAEMIRHDFKEPKGGLTNDFPMKRSDGKIISALSSTSVLNQVHMPLIDNVYASREIYDKSEAWLGSFVASKFKREH